jgi:hypothetical protein
MMTRAKTTRRSASAAANAGKPAARPRTREWVLAKVPADLRQQVDRWASDWLSRKFSRLLELRAADPGPFNFRHTERWFTVYQGLTADECFKEIERNEVFWPLM